MILGEGRRWPVATMSIVTASVFGPYTAIGGLRWEQIAVYTAAAALILPAVAAGRWMSQPAVGVVATLGAVLLVAAVGSIWPPFDPSMLPSGGFLAGLDDLALPIAAIVLAQAATAFAAPARVLRAVLGTVIVAMCANAAVAVESTVVDLGPVLAAWWAPSGTTLYVATNAAEMGRYTGILNQPAEAGVLYAVALSGAIYLLRRRPVVLWLAASALTLGGALCVSKIFLLVGLPAAVVQAILTTDRRRPLCALIATAATAVAVAMTGVAAGWTGAKYLGRLTTPEGDAVAFYTGQRLGPGSTLGSVVDIVLHASPWAGIGAAGLDAPYDSAWVQMLVMAGIIGVAAYLYILLVLARAAWRRRHSATAALGGALVAITVGGSVGLPVLTANRCGTVLCLALGLTVLARMPDRQQPLEDRPIAPAPSVGVASRHTRVRSPA